MARCLVTGGAGFIGSHLVDVLLARGHEVRVLDNLSTGSRDNLAGVLDSLEFFEGDLLDLPTVRRAVEGVDYVFHEAAQGMDAGRGEDALLLHHQCVTATLHVLVASQEAGVRRVIYASSSLIYGNASQTPSRVADGPRPLSPLAVAKLASEEYCAAYSRVYGLQTVRLRYFTVFGPRQRHNLDDSQVVAEWIQSMLGGRSPVVQGDGRQARDFTSVHDVVQANLLAMEAPRLAGKVYNVASGRSVLSVEIIHLLNEILGTHLQPVLRKGPLGDVHQSRADLTRAQTELGFCPCTDLKRDLRECVEYYRLLDDRVQLARKEPATRAERVCS